MPRTIRRSARAAALLAACALVASTVAACGSKSSPAGGGSSAPVSPVRVGIGDETVGMFQAPAYKALKLELARYFVTSDVMHNARALLTARQYVAVAQGAGASVLLHISTTDLRPGKGKVVAPAAYARDVKRFAAVFTKLGVRDFGAWNEENNRTQETYDHVANAVAYFKSMWTAVHGRCATCNVVGLDVLDQPGVDGYIKRFYALLNPTWRKRLGIIGIHDYSDVNRGGDSGTKLIIDTVRAFNPDAKFWLTETGALASFGASFPFDEQRQAARIANMFTLASEFADQGVQRVYTYNFFGVARPGCGARCPFDAGLADANGVPRPVYKVFASKLRGFSR